MVLRLVLAVCATPYDIYAHSYTSQDKEPSLSGLSFKIPGFHAFNKRSHESMLSTVNKTSRIRASKKPEVSAKKTKVKRLYSSQEDWDDLGAL